jgi:hypothetical protein
MDTRVNCGTVSVGFADSFFSTGCCLLCRFRKVQFSRVEQRPVASLEYWLGPRRLMRCRPRPPPDLVAGFVDLAEIPAGLRRRQHPRLVIVTGQNAEVLGQCACQRCEGIITEQRSSSARRKVNNRVIGNAEVPGVELLQLINDRRQ